jgi:hypothetical protein
MISAAQKAAKFSRAAMGGTHKAAGKRIGQRLMVFCEAPWLFFYVQLYDTRWGDRQQVVNRASCCPLLIIDIQAAGAAVQRTPTASFFEGH